MPLCTNTIHPLTNTIHPLIKFFCNCSSEIREWGSHVCVSPAALRLLQVDIPVDKCSHFWV